MTQADEEKARFLTGFAIREQQEKAITAARAEDRRQGMEEAAKVARECLTFGLPATACQAAAAIEAKAKEAQK